MNNQIETTFGEIGRAITGKTPSSDDPDDFGKGYPFVTPTDSLDSKYVLHTARQLSDEGLRKLKSKALPPDSILVSCIGSAMGKVVMNSTTCITNQQFNSIIVDTARFCPHYVYYALRNSYKLLRNAASGSTALPMLNKTDFEKLKIRVFKDKTHQRKISSVLSALDAKIALNHRINGELEGMAKLLYDYWFVQYDFPLSAAQAAALGKPRLAGKPYRSSGGPMVYHEHLKREIPKGWKVGDLEELCSMVRGVTYSKADVRTPTDRNTVPILRATNVNNGIVDLSDLVYVTENMPSEDQYLDKFDILVVMSSGSKAHVGKNALYCYDRKVAYGAFCSKVVPNPSSRFFVAVHMQSDPFKKYISNVCRGTSINNLTNAHITKHQLPIPPQEKLQEFEKTVSSFFETIACNHQQNQELITLRDWLLPMLMNGQVRVS